MTTLTAAPTTTQATCAQTEKCIVALADGRGAASEVGACAFGLSSSICYVGQLADTPSFGRTLSFLTLHQPSTILISSPGDAVLTGSKLRIALEEHFEADTIRPIPRGSFNDTQGERLLSDLCLSSDLPSIRAALERKHFAYAAMAALFAYLESSMNLRFLPGTVFFRIGGLGEGILEIDFATTKSLELVANLKTTTSKEHLLGVIDHCRTKMGRRMLRLNVLQPPCKLELITSRQEAVQELIVKGHCEVRDGLSALPDVDSLISQFVQVPRVETPKDAEQRVQLLLSLRLLLKSHSPLSTLLAQFENPLLRMVCKSIESEELFSLKALLDSTLNEDLTGAGKNRITHTQRAFAIKATGLLEVARKTLEEGIDDVNEYAEALAAHLDLPLEVRFKAPRGFHLTLTQKQLGGRPLPEAFCNITGTTRLFFTTLDLLKLNERINESLNEIYLLSDQVALDAVRRVRALLGSLYKASEALAMLDMLCSFAEDAGLVQGVRPAFSSDAIAIREGRHPILARSPNTPETVPNDTLMCKDGASLVIVTGPNGSGKSTLLKQVALLTIQAHMGMFIAAEAAEFRLTDAIFARIGSDDDMLANASSFGLEMRQLAHALRGMTENSLLLLDELGRGTSIRDGMCLTVAVCEYLSAECSEGNPFTMLATHQLHAVSYLQSLSNTATISLSVAIDSEQGISYLYKAQPGECSMHDYGLLVAQRILGDGIVGVANEACQRIKAALGQDDGLMSLRLGLLKRRLIRETAAKMRQVYHANFDVATRANELKALRENFVKELSRFEEF